MIAASGTLTRNGRIALVPAAASACAPNIPDNSRPSAPAPAVVARTCRRVGDDEFAAMRKTPCLRVGRDCSEWAIHQPASVQTLAISAPVAPPSWRILTLRSVGRRKSAIAGSYL